MKTELFNYDIYPKVVKTGMANTITVKPLGRHAAFSPDIEYTIRVLAVNEGSVSSYPARDNMTMYPAKPDCNGNLVFAHHFSAEEQEYFIRIYNGDSRIVQLAVYAVGAALWGRLPYMGDLHMHSFRSDGREAPEIVAANYRKTGYDFLAITDHRRYYPSLEAMKAYQEIDMDYLLVPGEEVHMPGTDVHIVNFGGEFSINALVEDSGHARDVGTVQELRSAYGTIPPPVLTKEAYFAEVEKLAHELNIPEGIERTSYAVCVWAFDQIRKAKGLGIFCHPYWISDVYQVPESFVEYMMEQQPFDAFEVLGGENYFEQNGFQAIRYYEDRIKGRTYPIVGSTDSHGSVNNSNSHVARTIVFAKEKTKNGIISSIEDRYSVAIDSINSDKLRVVGEINLARYAFFLLNHYFPIHDDLCYEEGRLMKEYACGNKEAGTRLHEIGRQMDGLRAKYFSV